MSGKFFAKLFILFVTYLFVCAIIYFVSYFALVKKIFIDMPAFRAVQKSLYYGPYLEVWQNKHDCITYDEELIYVPKIGACRHKNAEFDVTLNFTKSGRLMPKIKNKNTKPIIVLGDSHAMGWGVNDDKTFSYVLQNLSKTPVYNLAVSSYGTVREVIRLEKSGLLEKSDIIIIQYHENDLEENLNFSKLKKNEYLNIFSKMTSSSLSADALDIKQILRSYKSSLRLIFTDITGFFIKKRTEENFDPHYKPLIESIKKIKNFREKKIIIFYSDSLQFRFRNFPNGYDKENLNIYFHNIFNIEFNQKNYFYLDKHPNNLGHKKIGENLYNILKTNLLIN